ncbi:MAG TPA: hypothetical protein VGN49_12655 [Micrococcaceae bacterium]|jgi:hypothetical protein|nr:hypothetical protein [Micrococcaceae bacterium]
MVQTATAEPAVEARNLRLSAGGPSLTGDDLVNRLAELDSEPVRSLLIPVEETPVSFNIWANVARWVGTASHQGLGLVLSGRGFAIDGVELQRVRDIEPYLRGRREQIRAMRHEG